MTGSCEELRCQNCQAFLSCKRSLEMDGKGDLDADVSFVLILFSCHMCGRCLIHYLGELDISVTDMKSGIHLSSRLEEGTVSAIMSGTRYQSSPTTSFLLAQPETTEAAPVAGSTTEEPIASSSAVVPAAETEAVKERCVSKCFLRCLLNTEYGGRAKLIRIIRFCCCEWT